MAKARKFKLPWFSWGAVVGIVLTVLIARLLALGELQDEPLGARWVYSSYDVPFGFREHIRTREAVILFMDEDAHGALKQTAHQAWDRRLHARLIRRLTAEGAKVIVLDSLFFQKGDPQADAELAEAMKQHGRVVIGSMVDQGEADAIQARTTLRVSEVFRNVAASGVANLDVDSGGYVRRAFQLSPETGIEAPTLAEKAAELSGYVLPEKYRKAGWLNYFGPAGYLPWQSYHLALEPEGTPPGYFKDKVVFIGLRTAAGFSFDQRDEYDTPYTMWDGNRASGVEIHATRFLNLIHGNGLHRLSSGTEAILFGIIGIALGWGLTVVRPLLAAIFAVGACVVIAGFSFLLFKSNYWWAWAIAAGVQVPVALAWAVTFNTVRLKIESKTLERSLALHLSPKRAKQISKNPALLGLVAEKHEVSILFSDIANFSTITARMHPADLFKLLSSYFETTLACIHRTDGTVVKLIGDAIFAIWNAPFPQEKHAKAAVQAALEMRDQLVQFDAQQQSLPLQTRIGLHLGDAFVGNVGSKERMDYTAIGDSINLASRLEGLNKYLGTKVLGTRDIQRVVEEDFSSRLVGHFVFKGIDRAVEVHEFLGAKGESPAWKAVFAEALFGFQRRNFEVAAKGFRKTIEMRGEDGPSEFYLAQIDKLAKSELSESWAGEVRLTDK